MNDISKTIGYADKSWNPITGCLNHINGMCKGGNFPCYAYRLANGRLKPMYLSNNNYAPDVVGKLCVPDFDPFYPRFWQERLIEPMHKYRRWGKHNAVIHEQSPKRIFVCDMSDLFGIGIPQQWQEQVFNTIKRCPQHTFLLLTKQPQNLAKFSPFPDNCHVGVSATNADMFIEGCKHLSKIEANVKYISVEPLLSWDKGKPGFIATMLQKWDVNWLIIGQQTPISARTTPKIEWTQEIVEAADKAGIPVFLKDNLTHIFVRDSKEADLQTFQETFHWALNSESKLRQELP